MKKYDTIFLDRDGTLNPDPGYINDLNHFKLFPFTLDALKKMSKVCNRFCIVTNQSGIGRGKIKQEKLDEIHDYIRSEFEKHHIRLLDIYVCPDHPDHATTDRKPETGMFEDAARNYNIDLNRSLMIGDAGSDIEAGAKLKMDTMLVLTGKGSETLQNLDNVKPSIVVENLLAGAELIAS
ncbi:MAG TPA: HAD family hydrolase [Candidatus Marinimicrobia bacterium]|nr:HAD family hydrolase [Candidatus Neomarinimicrobiota bacterium]